ncbi:MAG: HflC protein [Betaproteobacteria bacterium RIFCSPLOWO2_02_67_12]|nr:MAG: HflC protein [Betaproteobacteria bacterium RIFCSPLOWO2_02_67_12]OGA28140.1 MAG: HflC protein [Betaproteobacteria bacterium RIFCSPLOWO2_02_FULL_68_150]OGA71683.1 MAG: HflC protein [Betaproteobacteria bacterium RIFCSPLOWO2_12_FULL_67_28]
MKALGPLLAAVVALALLASGSLFTVDQRQHAIVFQLGEVKDVITKPGLNFKWPLIQNVRYFDMRILTFEDAEPLRFITSEKKPVLVDSFVKWRIVDVKEYFVSVQGDELRAATRLKQTISDGLQAEFGKRTVHDVVSGERDKIMELMRDKADQDLRRIGVEIIDVRLKRVDLPQEVSESVYGRMQAERKRIANEQRSTGAAEAERVRADADRQREVILAEAYRDAQRARGEGDAKAAATYAQAFQQNAEFYSFYRSMEAYRSSFRGKSDLLLLEPNSDFFRYLKDAAGRPVGKK